MRKAALVCCSDGLKPEQRPEIEQLKQILSTMGVEPVESPRLYRGQTVFSGTAAQRAELLNGFFADPTIDAIFDVSGGDLASELADFLDYSVIKASHARLWGYSDLTSLLNAIYAQTGREGVLWQARSMTWACGENQQRDLQSGTLFTVPVEFLQGSEMEGVLVGGNIRCLLKLAGTPYFPDLTEKLLLLESLSGSPARINAYLSQLRQMGAFRKVRGIVLGTFTEMEQKKYSPSVEELLLAMTDKPVAKTKFIGHGPDARAAVIGRTHRFP